MLERLKKQFAKLQQQEEVSTLTVKDYVQATESIEAQIHRDVYSAQDLLIQEANRILSQAVPYNEERREQLSELLKLGFSGASEVAEFTKIEHERMRHQEIQELISNYNKSYPLNKFINKETVKVVCGKYNLYLTGVSDYISDIPDKNKMEIVNFRVKLKDYRFPQEIYPRHFWTMDHYEIPVQFENKKLPGKYLLIMAPEHKIDMQGKIKVGHVLTKDDPIVLQPVNGGYLIVSSWGLEAGDPLIVNSVNN